MSETCRRIVRYATMAAAIATPLGGCAGPNSENPRDAGVDRGASLDVSSESQGDGGDSEDSGLNLPLSIPQPSHPGPCSRNVTIGVEGLVFSSFAYDYTAAPNRVVVTQSTEGQPPVLMTLFDTDHRRRCNRPPEDLHAAFLDFVGCPRRATVDTGGNGLISPQDFSVEYRYDEHSHLVAADRFDWEGQFSSSAWFNRYSRAGALLSGERIDGDNTAAEAEYEYVGDDTLVLRIDTGDDGDIDTEATYSFDAEGNVIRAEVLRADPGTGELLRSSQSDYFYDCWE